MTDGRTPKPTYANELEKNAGTPPSALPQTPRHRLALILLRSTIRQLGWRYGLYVLTVIVLSAVFLLPPRFLQYFTESTERLERLPASTFLSLLAGFGIAVAAALWLSTFLGGILREWLRLKVSLNLRRDSLRAMHGTPLAVFDQAHRGDWMTRLTGDLHNVEEFLSDSIPRQIQSLTLVIGSAMLFLSHSGPVALIPCVAAIFLAWLNLRVQRRVAPVLTEARELEGEVFQDLMENYEGLRTIRSAGAEASVMTRFNQRLESVRDAGMRIIRSMAGLMSVNEFASQLIVTAVLTTLAWSVKQGTLTVTDVLVYPFFINVLLGNTRVLAATAYDWNRFFVEGGRLAELLAHAKDMPTMSTNASVPTSVETIAVSELRIGFADSPPLLDRFAMTLTAGDLIAITGASGCGKSTLLEVLAGIRSPQEGEFRVDGHPAGPSLSTQHSAYVEQRPYLFVGTIRQNLTLGLSSEASPEDSILWSSLDELGLRELVQDRGGLDAVLTDAIAEAMDGVDHLYVSVDIDCLDPAYAPGTGTPEPGGLASADLLRALRRLARETPLVGFDLMEVAPAYDHADCTVNVAHRCIMEVLAGLASVRRDAGSPNVSATGPLR